MNKIIKLFIFVLCIQGISFTLTAQDQEYASTNKKAIKFFEEGLKHYQSRNNQYAEASLIKALGEDPNFIDAHMVLGNIYIDQMNYESAYKHLKKSIEIDPEFYAYNYYHLGKTEMQLAKYDDAYAHLEKFVSYQGLYPKFKLEALKLVKDAVFAKEAIKTPVKFEPQNMGGQINSEEAEYFPTITGDDAMLLYTRMLKSQQAPRGFNEDFYVSYKKDGEWQNSHNLGYPINTPLYMEGAPSLSADGRHIFYTTCASFGKYPEGKTGYGSCDIFYSRIEGKKWTEPENLGPVVNSKYWESQPCFSADGKTLYFVKRVKKEGKIEQDIFSTIRNEDGTWSPPQKLSDKINTEGREESVFIHPDGRTLYFASDGHPGFGGLDIYMSKLDENGEWGTPINLGYPINTAKDENSLLVSTDGTLAYFASDREGGLGKLDIYSFELDEKIRPERVTYTKGIVYDAKSKIRLGAKFELIDLDTKEVIVASESDPQLGDFLVSLPTGKSYALNVSKPGYLFFSENFSLEEKADNEPYKLNVPLQSIEEGSTVVLKNVFFDTDQFNLKSKSIAELQKLVDFMKKNPTVEIELGGHTDNIGDKAHNQTLSENRAKSVQDFLIEHGIEASRLSFKGYGDTVPHPKGDNTTEEGRAKNRRTEFKIIKR